MAYRYLGPELGDLYLAATAERDRLERDHPNDGELAGDSTDFAKEFG